MNRRILILMAAVLTCVGVHAQEDVMLEKYFRAWNEAAQKDTSLSLFFQYGKKREEMGPVRFAEKPKYKIYDAVKAFGIYMTQGNPEIKEIAGKWCNRVDIFSTSPQKKEILKGSDLRRQMDCLRRSLIKAKENFVRWRETAKREHVTSYRKVMCDDEIFDVPCRYKCYHKKDGLFYYNVLDWQIDTLKTEFVVDNKGRCRLLMTGHRNIKDQTTTFVREQVEATYGGLVQRDVKKTYSVVAEKAGLWFSTPEQIQSLIDILDFDALEAEAKEKFGKNDPRDDLFK